ncbi:D-alanyl-D-alanine carboxypeptidase [Vibrio sp. 10N.286.49.C2]|uniref:D-alanyl-D-alanine carboxypeptidase family protein n=1 Tax=unclassified Vibrio TaxID=2614977 RepID=UPI000C848250|nr:MULTISPECIES: D-alanyl-D-alanine carboxypeptidase family protein [unclassified Vibrio]PMH40741.1 D-alanyl-D-alanine carboxypeptidase [Vibrio sp. 10N.286.49.C2]PMH45272.1 D-alanyl-D-alanine carboxypeptidase [Vibrio sp. 10N.286.49.B1]PMH78278.1 D-alanyl-D-alanine carboxypeptidase [Vibrio sp. 10N.286.48.B7]
MNKSWSLLLASMTLCSSAYAYALVTPNPPTLNAKGYVLMDYQSGSILVSGNQDEALAPASLTKLMTAYVVGKEIESGRTSWDSPVAVSENAWSVKFPDSSKMFIKPGDSVTVADLMRGLIIQSGNDSAVALAEHIAGTESGFVALMNQWAISLGMDKTEFINAHGLDGDGIHTTPQNMAVLMRRIIEDVPEVYDLYAEKRFTWADIKQYNRNRLLWDNSLNVDGGKTGYTSEAGYSLVSSATQGQMRLISVVMGTPSTQTRVEASRQLLNYGFRFYETEQLALADKDEKSLRVWKGEGKQISVGFEQDVYATYLRGKGKQLSKDVEIYAPLIAPVKQGDIVGNVTWRIGNDEIISEPLVAKSSVEQGSIFTRIIDTVVLWFKSLFSDAKSLW